MQISQATHDHVVSKLKNSQDFSKCRIAVWDTLNNKFISHSKGRGKTFDNKPYVRVDVFGTLENLLVFPVLITSRGTQIVGAPLDYDICYS